MNYIGCKLSLLDFLETSIKEIVPDINNKTFCDLFAGTGTVGLHFKKLGCKIISNDLQYYSFVLNKHYIGNHKPLYFWGIQDIIPNLSNNEDFIKINIIMEYLNGLEGIQGFIYFNYSPNQSNDRQYFTTENAKKCDAIRSKIEYWRNENKITDDEYFFLLTSLLESIDKRANTASVYGAFLKDIKKSAREPMRIKPAQFYINETEHEVYNDDANDLIKQIARDILYLDPPYNARQYSSNYHILETIARYDNPVIIGKTGLRKDNKKSKYCSKALVKKEFKDLINTTSAKYIFLSYNNEGLLSFEEIKEIMSSQGQYGYFTKDYNRFKADNNRKYSSNKTVEYLHYLIKN